MGYICARIVNELLRMDEADDARMRRQRRAESRDRATVEVEHESIGEVAEQIVVDPGCHCRTVEALRGQLAAHDLELGHKVRRLALFSNDLPIFSLWRWAGSRSQPVAVRTNQLLVGEIADERLVDLHHLRG